MRQQTCIGHKVPAGNYHSSLLTDERTTRSMLSVTAILVPCMLIFHYTRFFALRLTGSLSFFPPPVPDPYTRFWLTLTPASGVISHQ